MAMKSVLLYVDLLDMFIYYIFIILLRLILQSRVLFGGDFIFFNFLLVYVLIWYEHTTQIYRHTLCIFIHMYYVDRDALGISVAHSVRCTLCIGP